MERQVSSISVKFEMIGQVSSIWTNWRWHDKLVVFQLSLIWDNKLVVSSPT
jgi:hypothetical protein